MSKPPIGTTRRSTDPRQAAEAAFKKAIELRPNYPEAYNALAVAGMKTEDLVAGAQPIDGERLFEQLDRGTIALSY